MTLLDAPAPPDCEISSELAHALAAAARATSLLVAVDFDGTIAELGDDPARISPVPGAIETIGTLGSIPSTRAAILSGRTLADLRRRVGAMSGVALAGSYGLEIDDPPASVRMPIDEARKRELDDAAFLLSALAGGMPGAHVEIKRHAVAFHVRPVAPERRAAALKTAAGAVAHLESLKIIRGKDVIECVHPAADKAAALRAIARDAEVVIYVGDDEPDERAFSTLRPSDVGIKVGPGASAARFRVPSPTAAAAAINATARLRSLLCDR